jgi:hypothetical protein
VLSSPNFKKKKLTPKTYPFSLPSILGPESLLKSYSHNVSVGQSQ